MTHSGQTIIGLTLAAVLLIVAIEGRPQYFDTNANEIEQIQPGQIFNPLYAYPVMNRISDSQYEKLRLFLDGQQQDAKDDGISGGGAAENLLREPLTKRQAVRYRQCYFNPISCFRK